MKRKELMREVLLESGMPKESVDAAMVEASKILGRAFDEDEIPNKELASARKIAQQTARMAHKLRQSPEGRLLMRSEIERVRAEKIQERN